MPVQLLSVQWNPGEERYELVFDADVDDTGDFAAADFTTTGGNPSSNAGASKEHVGQRRIGVTMATAVVVPATGYSLAQPENIVFVGDQHTTTGTKTGSLSAFSSGVTTMGLFFYGKFARYGLSSTAYDGKGWSVDPKVDDLRTDNTADGGYSSRIGGISDCPFVIEQDWDANSNPMDDPPGIRAGAKLTALKLYFDKMASASPYWSFPKALVLGTPVNCMIDAICHITANCANNGIYYRPDGDFTPTETSDNVEP